MAGKLTRVVKVDAFKDADGNVRMVHDSAARTFADVTVSGLTAAQAKWLDGHGPGWRLICEQATPESAITSISDSMAREKASATYRRAERDNK